MANKRENFILFLVLALFLAACQEQPTKHFETKIPKSKKQFFEIKLDNDTVFLTSNDAMLVIPKCAFKLEEEILTNETVIIEFAEFYKPIDFLEANLTTTSDKGELLESAGMFYLDVKTVDGRQVEINEACALLLRFGTKNSIPNLKNYKGIVRDGQVYWTEPQELEKWLTPIPLKNLHLYANPKRSRQINLGKPILEPKAKLIFQPGEDGVLFCGVQNSLIDTLYSTVFENTLVATKEFESRIRCIHQACSVELLQLYLSNLDKNLYEIDSLAFQFLQQTGSEHAQNFNCFYQQKLTKIPIGNEYSFVYIKAIQDREQAIKEDIEKKRKSSLIYQTARFSVRGFLNVDAQQEFPNIVEILEEFKLETASINIEHAEIYCITQNYNSVARLDYDPQLKHYKFGTCKRYISDKVVGIYAIASDGKQDYSCFIELKIGEKKLYNLELLPTELEEIGKKMILFGLLRPENLFTFPKNDCCFYEYSGL